jgi:hypothetical protein
MRVPCRRKRGQALFRALRIEHTDVLPKDHQEKKAGEEAGCPGEGLSTDVSAVAENLGESQVARTSMCITLRVDKSNSYDKLCG